MDLTVKHIDDDTPKGLTTGFRLKLACEVGGKSFVLEMPILMSKDAVQRGIPLPVLALRYLEREGFDSWPDLFVDTRRLDLEDLPPDVPALPCTIILGGAEPLNKMVVEKLPAA